ncbi:MAG: sensor histidine kinase [Candidatus Limnocylindria bacterium]
MRLALSPTRLRWQTSDAIAQVARLDSLVDNILDSVRAGTPDIAVRRTRFDLRAAVAASLRELAPLLRGHRLGAPRAGAALWVAGDRRRTAEVVGGLVHNATKYAPPGTRIAVRIGRERGRGVVRVADEGRGVPPNERDRIFDPFVRAVDVPAPGTGIGLYASRRLVEAQGGELWYEDPPRAAGARRSRGAVFAFSVPVWRARA